MHNVYIGIDPSINNSGLYIIKDDNYKAYIIKPYQEKISKKEKIIRETLSDFEYIAYDKTDLKQYKEDNIKFEYYKTLNMISIANCILSTIEDYLKDDNIDKIFIVQEGISYGSSLRTKSIYDLAGLNYLIRDRFIKNSKYTFIVATPSQIKKFATGNGNCNKEVIVELYKSIHPTHKDIPKIDDIADAYFMALYAKYYSDNILNENIL